MVVGLRHRRAGKRAAGRGVWRALFASCAALISSSAFGAIPEAVNTGREWRVYKSEWSPADEKGYSAFVTAIGRSNCSSLADCLEGDANPYRHTDKWRFNGDCADMAYMLRAYYAWKNGLPFSYQNAMRTADGSRQDLRYSTSGNIVAGRRQILNHVPNAPAFISRIAGEVSTAMFRTDPESGGGRSFDDFYPVEITREAVRPGLIAYDIYGHVGIVYDVTQDGRVLIVASHPDNSVTRTVYGSNFMRAKPALGAALKAWRPIKVEGASRTADGRLQGGKLRAQANDEIEDFSLTQFYGNEPHAGGEWHYGEFRLGGRALSYYDYVRRRLAAPDFAYDPVDEMRHALQTICGAIRDRKVAVDRAVAAGMHRRPHPGKLPPNIYGTYGDWEEHSTPSRDARLKVSFLDLRRNTQEFVERVERGDASVRYDGRDLAGDLWRAYEEEKSACKTVYRRSDDTRVILTLGHVMERLWDLSFDPYHCPERRWGAGGAEAETCTDGEEKTRWYNAQRFLRYQADRTYDVRMDFTLEELQPPMAAPPEEGGLGVDAPADADLAAYLAQLNGVSLVRYGGAPPMLTRVTADEDTLTPAFPAWHANGGRASRP